MATSAPDDKFGPTTPDLTPGLLLPPGYGVMALRRRVGVFGRVPLMVARTFSVLVCVFPSEKIAVAKDNPGSRPCAL